MKTKADHPRQQWERSEAAKLMPFDKPSLPQIFLAHSLPQMAGECGAAWLMQDLRLHVFRHTATRRRALMPGVSRLHFKIRDSINPARYTP